MKIGICEECGAPIFWGSVDDEIVPCCPRGGMVESVEFVDFEKVFKERWKKDGKDGVEKCENFLREKYLKTLQEVK